MRFAPLWTFVFFFCGEAAAQLPDSPESAVPDVRLYLRFPAKHQIWRDLPGLAESGGQRLPPDEERLVLDTAIQAGLKGDAATVRELLDGVSWFRREAIEYWSDMDSRVYEDAYDAKQMILTRMWTAAYFSFYPHEADDQFGFYERLMPERRRSTRALYGTYAHMRFHPKWDQSPDTAIKGSKVHERLPVRRKIAQQLWSPQSGSLKAEISANIRQVRASLQEEGEFYRVNVGEALAEVLRADLYGFTQSMPDDTSVVDLVQYDKIERRATGPTGEGDRIAYSLIPHYCAIVISAGNTSGFKASTTIINSTIPTISREREYRVLRADLGTCDAVDGAVQQWRDAIDDGGEAREAGERVAQLVWHPIAQRLLPDVTRIYFVPDGYLSAVPWCAIPLDGSRHVIDQYSTASLPYAEYLVQAQIPGVAEINSDLEHLPGVLGIGKVAPDLPYTEQEILDLKERVAPAAWTALLDTEATVERVLEELPKAGHVHFAVHGLFGRSPLERARRHGLLGTGRSSQDSLYFSCLRLAKANPDDQPQDCILTADMIAELNLSGLKLAVLSACQTGEGEGQPGEGIFALTRAFHLAGCEEVVATSWPINDRRAAQLMKRCYELHFSGTPLLDALTLAQREIRDGPATNPVASGDRGSPLDPNSQFEAEPTTTEPDLPAKGERTAPKYWAAFALSGTGGIPRPMAPCEWPELPRLTNAYQTPVILNQYIFSQLSDAHAESHQQ